MSLRTLIEEVLTEIATDWVDHESRIVTLRSDVDALEAGGGGTPGDIIDDTAPSTSKTYSSSKIEQRITASAGAVIDDTTASTTKVYSSSKVTQYVTDQISAFSQQLIDSAPGTLDTLNELAAALGDDPNFSATVTTALANRIRFDTAQALTTTQKAQALANIGAISAADVGDTNTSLVAVYQAAKS